MKVKLRDMLKTLLANNIIKAFLFVVIPTVFGLAFYGLIILGRIFLDWLALTIGPVMTLTLMMVSVFLSLVWLTYLSFFKGK